MQIHAVVADGLSVNRSFFKLISGEKKVPLDRPFTAPNMYAPDRRIYLCSDPPHLLKVLKHILYNVTVAVDKMRRLFIDC